MDQAKRVADDALDRDRRRVIGTGYYLSMAVRPACLVDINYTTARPSHRPWTRVTGYI